jgi:hypothetical protein
LKNSILLSFLALAVLSGLWIINNNPNSSNTLDEEPNLELPNNASITKNEDSDIKTLPQISVHKNDSIPIYVTLDMAIDGILNNSKLTKTQTDKNDLFELKKSIGNNYSLEYYINTILMLI